MTPEQLKNSRFNAFSIIEVEKGKKVLIFLCENKSMADNLYDLLSTNNYKLTIGVGLKKNYKFELDFLDKGFKFQYDTEQTTGSYPPLLWLANQSVGFVTTGIKGEGQQRYWNDVYLPLIRPLMN